MEKYTDIINNLIYFVIFVIVILMLLSIFLHFYLKKFNFNPKKSRLYGMLSQLDNKSQIAFAISTLIYLFLVWNAMKTVEMNLLYSSIIIILGILPGIFIKDAVKTALNFVISLINCFTLYILHFVHIYLIGEVSDIYMRISIFFIVAFSFIYFTYNYLNDINDIVTKNKFIQKKKNR